RCRVSADDADHGVLAHLDFLVDTVRFGGDQSVFGIVVRTVGVEQEKINAADVKLPNLGENFAVQNAYRHEKICAVALDFANWQMMKILIEADGLLRALFVDFLPEISVAIKQTDRDEI